MTSGAVALGKVRLATSPALNGMLEFQRNSGVSPPRREFTDPRAAAATGQAGLMALYEQMFAQFGLSCAQVLTLLPIPEPCSMQTVWICWYYWWTF